MGDGWELHLDLGSSPTCRGHRGVPRLAAAGHDPASVAPRSAVARSGSTGHGAGLSGVGDVGVPALVVAVPVRWPMTVADRDRHRGCAGPGHSAHREGGGGAVGARDGGVDPAGARVRSPSWPPRTPVAAAGLIWEGPRLLLLRTTYKPNWTLPGGCVEEGESPLQACLREVEEEPGLIRTTGTLRCVDHRKPDDRVVGGLRFIFDLGACSPVRTSHFGCRLRKSLSRGG